MSDPNWVEHAVVIRAHDEALRLFGGLPGIYPYNLNGVLQRPQMAYQYGDLKPDIIELAAIYMHGPEAQVRNIVNEPPYPTRAFVEAWLDRKDKHRAWIVFWTLIFAAVAAVPAVPIIWGIIGP